MIRAVPMDEDFRKELLSDYDSYNEKNQYAIVSVLWDAFDLMESVLHAYHEALITQEVATGKLQVESIPNAVQEAVDRDIEDRITGKKADDANLDSVRHHLEKLMHPSS